MSWGAPQAPPEQQEERVWTRGDWSVSITTGYPAAHAPVHVRVEWGRYSLISSRACGMDIPAVAKRLTDTLIGAGWQAAADVLAEALAELEEEA